MLAPHLKGICTVILHKLPHLPQELHPIWTNRDQYWQARRLGWGAALQELSLEGFGPASIESSLRCQAKASWCLGVLWRCIGWWRWRLARHEEHPRRHSGPMAQSHQLLLCFLDALLLPLQRLGLRLFGTLRLHREIFLDFAELGLGWLTDSTNLKIPQQPCELHNIYEHCDILPRFTEKPGGGVENLPLNAQTSVSSD